MHGNCAAAMKLTINTKLIKRLRNLDLGLEVKVGIGELLALTKSALCKTSLALIFRLCIR